MKRKTYLNIFNIEIVQKVLGQFEPSQFIVDGCETFFILWTFGHPTAFANVIQAIG